MGIDLSASPMTKGGQLYFNESGTEELVTEVNLPEGTKKIKQCVFLNCSTLKKVTIPDSVTEIGIRAFEGCDLLTEIKADGVKVVQGQTFQSMKGLKTVSLKGAEKLEREVFFMCSNLETVYFGAGLHDIGQRCFVGTALKDVYFDGTKEEWIKVKKDGYINGEYWDKVPKGDCWNYGLGTYKVHLKNDEIFEEKGAVYD